MVDIPMTTGPINALQTVNDLTVVNGIPLLGVTILGMLWLTLFFSFRSQGTSVSLAVSSWGGTIFAILLAYLDLIPDQVMATMIAVSLISAIPVVYQR